MRRSKSLQKIKYSLYAFKENSSENYRKNEGENERRQKALEDKTGDAKPLSEVLNRIIKKSPALKNFLISGSKITNPFELADQQGDSGKISSAEKNRSDGEFQGQFFPTFFRLRKQSSGYLMKVVPKNRKARVVFETDAANGYFGRDDRPGQT